jgi:hypothetical protein
MRNMSAEHIIGAALWLAAVGFCAALIGDAFIR